MLEESMIEKQDKAGQQIDWDFLYEAKRKQP